MGPINCAPNPNVDQDTKMFGLHERSLTSLKRLIIEICLHAMPCAINSKIITTLNYFFQVARKPLLWVFELGKAETDLLSSVYKLEFKSNSL